MAETIDNKKDKGKNKAAEMPFWDHLEVLRWHIVKAVVAVLVFSIIAFLNREIIFDTIILGPISNDFITTVLLCKLGNWLDVTALCMDNSTLHIININMSGQFMTHMYVSMAAGLIVAFPYVIWEIWSFVQPALSGRETKSSGLTVLVISFLFLLGVFFSYFLIVPLTINFLGTYQVSSSVENQVALSSYISTVVSVTFAVGVVFELPILVYYLAKMGVITAAWLKKSRKTMLVIILAVSAIITPPDIFSQVLVSLPLMLLYEAGIIIARRVENRKAKLADKV
ncbi:MAG: twin-arginine translocase subunit TatC [Bacteroidales bacterium]|nr:twin-arginine translocase subunit TatC [Bacteroidales bacterium]